MRKFTFRQLAVSGLVCLSLSCIQPAAAASSVQVGFRHQNGQKLHQSGHISSPDSVTHK